MKKIVVLTLCVLFCAGSAFGAKLYLKDGRVIEGRLITNKPEYVAIKYGGTIERFYATEIDRLDEVDQEPLEEYGERIGRLSKQKQTQIRRLLKVNGTETLLRKNINAVVQNLPPDKQDEIKGLFDVNDAMDAVVPIYHEHYTLSEVMDMISFFESQTGQRMIQENSQVLDETIRAVLQYLQRAASK